MRRRRIGQGVNWDKVWSASKKDFRVDTFKSGGPGGQHQNKTDSGVRITHIKTGLSAESREYREQYYNKREAFKKLANLLLEHFKSEWTQDRPEVSNEVVRTYNVVDNRVKDHASGLTQTYDEVEDDLSDMIIARHNAKT